MLWNSDFSGELLRAWPRDCHDEVEPVEDRVERATHAMSRTACGEVRRTSVTAPMPVVSVGSTL
jgi:hypothetical protein